MDKVQQYNSFNTNTPSLESYRNYLFYFGSCKSNLLPLESQNLLILWKIARRTWYKFYI
jgi:hypothetical protein